MCALPICPLQKDDPTPLYLQLQKILRDAIEVPVVKAEEAIPTERDLAAEFAVSRITVRKAIDGLVADGIVTRRRGTGTFVTPPPVEKIRRAHVGTPVANACPLCRILL